MPQDPTVAELWEIVRLLKMTSYRRHLADHDCVILKCYTQSRAIEIENMLNKLGVDKTAPGV